MLKQLAVTATALLLLIGNSTPACEAFVVIKSVGVYKETDSQYSFEHLKRGDIVLPNPSNADAKMLLYFTGFTFRFCACSFVEQNRSNGKIKIIYFSPEEKKWRDGWIDTDSGVKYEYTPELENQITTRLNGTHDVSKILTAESYTKPGILKLDAELFKEFKAPEIKNSFSFTATTEQVWSAIVETLADNQIPINVIDKSSGLITTRPAADPKADSMVCATALDEDNQVSFNIFIKQNNEQVTVKINSTFSASRDNVKIKCASNGVLETWLSSGVEKKLPPAPPTASAPSPASTPAPAQSSPAKP